MDSCSHPVTCVSRVRVYGPGLPEADEGGIVGTIEMCQSIGNPHSFFVRPK